MKKSYFAAANTENGFTSLFDDIFSPRALSRLYIIKGGPGTGKSTLMRGIAEKASEKGFDVEYYYCSSDTSSLDGIKILPLGVAVMDGTAPHTKAPRYPGAVDTIIDLGENFKTEKLIKNRENIIELTDRCSSYYASAKRFLHAAGEMERAKKETALAAFDSVKAKKAALRMIGRTCAEKGDIEERYISALGVRGKCRLDTAESEAKHIIKVTGRYGFPMLFLDVMVCAVRELGLSAKRYPFVLSRERTEAIMIGDTLFTVCEEETEDDGDIVNTYRFVDRVSLAQIRSKLRFTERCVSALIDGALESLCKMGKTHDELESYYIFAMDFEKNEKIKNKLISEIFGGL